MKQLREPPILFSQYSLFQVVSSKHIAQLQAINSSSMGIFNIVLARTYLQLPLRQWGAGNVYLLVLSSWKVNIAENPIAVMGL